MTTNSNLNTEISSVLNLRYYVGSGLSSALSSDVISLVHRQISSAISVSSTNAQRLAILSQLQDTTDDH